MDTAVMIRRYFRTTFLAGLNAQSRSRSNSINYFVVDDARDHLGVDSCVHRPQFEPIHHRLFARPISVAVREYSDFSPFASLARLPAIRARVQAHWFRETY